MEAKVKEHGRKILNCLPHGLAPL